MPLFIPQRVHAWIGGLGQSSDTRDLFALNTEVRHRFRAADLDCDTAQLEVSLALTTDVLAGFDLPPSHAQAGPIAELISKTLAFEGMFELPDIDVSKKYPTSECWEMRDTLIIQQKLVADYDKTFELLRLYFCHLIDPIYQAVPSLVSEIDPSDITVPSQLVHLLGKVGAVTHEVSRVSFAPEIVDAGLLPRTRDALEQNLVAASGGNPRDTNNFSRQPKYAHDVDASDPERLIDAYLGRTPISRFFNQNVDFAIPNAVRFEHHHIIAGSGHGKTQTLQHLISCDLEAVALGERSVVVLDSQGDLINNISNLAAFAPNGPLADRLVIIDPTDIEWPVSLNLFDVGQDRLGSYAPLERERLTNSILELYDFVLGSLLDAQMTQKQSVIFRYVTRLMLHIPSATIHTLRELMEDGAEVKFAPQIAKLSGTARHFFDTEFSSREFQQTKRQVLRRLWGILENQTFERMFSHPKSKLDLFSEMNAGKVILINTAKDLLKESGTEIFGRFFIALIAQAAQERATLRQADRMPTMVYIDEAADYFDRNIGIILSQARKYAVGMVLSHQYLGQLDPKLQEAFAANTSIKFAGGVSAKDARALAGQMGCDPALIERQPKAGYAASLRGVTGGAIPLRFPFGTMEKLPKMSTTERFALQEVMRERYAVHYSELSGAEAAYTDETQEPDSTTADDVVDPNAPTPHW